MMIQQQAALVALLLSTVQVQHVYSQELLWSDEFNATSSTVNPSYWSIRTGNNDGWGNGELQVYTSDVQNVGIVDSENLAITVLEHLSNTTPAVRTFSSGRIDTHEKVHIKYGTISAKIQVPNVDAGLWPAFWTLGAVNESFPFPSNGEMDIMEIGQGLAIEEGLANRRSISGAHWERDGAYTTLAGSRDFNFNLNDTFFVYTLEWTPFNITTYVNDDQVWTMDTTEANCADCEEFHRFHYLLLNVAVGGGFTSGSGSSSGGGGSSSSGCGGSSSSGGSSGPGCTLRTPEDITAPLPATMLVDWVRIFDNGYSEIVVVAEGPVTAPTPSAGAVTPPVAAPVVAPVPVPAPTTDVVTPPVAPTPVAPAAPVAVPVPTANVVVPTPTEEENIFFPTIFGGGGGKGGKGSGKGSGKGGKGGKGSGKGSGKGGKGGSGKNSKSSSEQSDLALTSAAGACANRHQVVTVAAVLVVALQQWFFI